ncbi:MAG: hypothetical protein MUO40_14685 [Anaerolineaceae bacterium]|nr:hypothetical protein [Anaerolineaceae bacterium]
MPSSLQKGIESAKSGQMDLALSHLKDAIIEEPENADVWVWLAAIIENEDKQIIFLNKALEIDPDNRPAQRGVAYIQRKKTVPPKPGEKLSDYTKPIGLFPNSPAEAKSDQPGSTGISQPEQVSPSFDEFTPTPGSQGIDRNSVSVPAKRNTAWVDIILYSIIFLVFLAIGVLVGSTLLKIPLPFLSQKEIVSLPVSLPSEGVFLLENITLQEMKAHQGPPAFEEGIPSTTTSSPTIVIHTPLITLETVELRYEDGLIIPLNISEIDPITFTLNFQQTAETGLYCLIHILNPDNNEALYWCFRID